MKVATDADFIEFLSDGIDPQIEIAESLLLLAKKNQKLLNRRQKQYE
jgi:hypothetical protein